MSSKKFVDEDKFLKYVADYLTEYVVPKTKIFMEKEIKKCRSEFKIEIEKLRERINKLEENPYYRKED